MIRFVFTFGLAAASCPAAVIMEQPVRYYQSASDSPYFSYLRNGTAYLNDFSQDEDGYAWVNGAGQTVWTEYDNEQYLGSQDFRWEFAERRFGVAHEPGGENLSVDGDDLKVDGWSDGGWGLSDEGFNSTPSMDLYFVTNYHTTYPVWIGFVLTTTGGFESGAPRVDLLGIGGNTIGSFSLFDIKEEMLTHSGFGQPAQFQRVFNDRLVVFHSDEPITRVKIFTPSMIIDHVQWGYSPVYVPEPGAAGLALLAGAALLRRKRSGGFRDTEKACD